MMGVGRTLFWIAVVVVFLSLSGIATTFYETDLGEQADLKSSQLIAKGQAAVLSFVNFASNLAKSQEGTEAVKSSSRGIKGFYQSLKDIFLAAIKGRDLEETAETISTEDLLDSNQQNFSELIELGAETFSGEINIFNQENYQDQIEAVAQPLFSYEKSPQGAKLVIQFKDKRYTLPVPFSAWLSKSVD
ncbi:MAG: hypothetical protein ACOX0C_00985 [Patescibacteria group bacterium]|jgi:hypothetical protein